MKHTDHRSRLVIRATVASMATAAIIIIAKTIAWATTDSSSVLASLIDSLLDIISSFINFLAARYAMQPPDSEHRFGHGKAEDLAVLVQSSFFIISGIFVTIIAVKKIITPQELDNSELGVWLVIFSLAISALLMIYQTYVIKSTSSNIIKADRLHYFTDFFTNGAVIVSLFLSIFLKSKIIDPIFAIMIAIYMLYEAFKLFKEAFRNLMDHEFSETDKRLLQQIITSHKDVKGFHDLKTRHSGSKPIIQFHLEMDGKVSLYEAHTIAEAVETLIKQKFKNAEVIIHQDPEGVNEKREFNTI
jgi:cation diffusion facilitator family transporter